MTARIARTKLPRDSKGLQTLVMARDADARGRPDAPATWFSAGVPRLTAFARVGDLDAPATLTMAWYRIDDAGREIPLFEHRIKVRAHQWAWSVGRSPGRLALGRYEVVASLGGRELFSWWDVQPGGAATPGAGPGRSRRAAASESGPPRPGDSGTTDEWPVDAAHGPACNLSVIADALFGLAALAGDTAADTTCGEVVLSAANGGAAQELARGRPQAKAEVWPCDLPGGTDLPGTVVQFTGRLADPPGTVVTSAVTLEDPGLPPVVAGTSNPPDGTRVEPRSRIHIEAGAMSLLWSPGLRHATLSVDGRGVAQWDSGTSQPTPCDPSRFLHKWQFDYDVPRNPPQVIEVLLAVEDYAGRKGVGTWRFPTRGKVWEGTLTAELEQEAGGGPQEFSALAEILLTEDADGNLTGRIDGPQLQSLELEHCPSYSKSPGRVGADMVGSHDGDRVRLEVASIQWIPPTMTPCEGGGEPATAASLLDPGYGPTLGEALGRLVRGDDGTYRGKATGNMSGPLSYEVELRPVP